MIDWGRVKELQEEIGAEDFAEVVDMFLEEAEEAVARLQTPQDTQSLAHDLHFLKGCALNIGFSHLAQICHDGEKQALNGGVTPGVQQAIPVCFSASRKAFEAQHSP